VYRTRQATGIKSKDDTQELHLKDTLVAGRYINRQDMVQTMIEGAIEQTHNLELYGVSLQKKGKEGFWVIYVPGHSVPGHLAAQCAKDKKHTVIEENFEEIDKEIRFDESKKKAFSIQDVRKELKALMWEKAGIIRTEQILAEVVNDIYNLEKNLDQSKIGDWKELVQKFEIKNMLLTAEMIAKSALLRKESRGSHFRDDLPNEGGEYWTRNIMVKPTGCGMELAYLQNNKT